MKNRHHFFEKPPTGAKKGIPMNARTCLFTILALAFIHLLSCSKDHLALSNGQQQQPLFSQVNTSNVTNLELSYDVVIKRNTSFRNGLDASSPGWKRMQAVPEKESYSLQVDIDNGDLYLLKDNIVVRSYLYDKRLKEDKITKLEVLNSTCTTYDSLGNVISSIPVGNLAQAILDSLGGNYYNTPVDTNLLAADGINFSVHGDKVVITTSMIDGEASNSTLMLDLNTGAILLELLYDDDSPTRLVSLASHGYDANGTLRSSSFTFYDYLSDGDLKRTDERWDYSNFSINLF